MDARTGDPAWSRCKKAPKEFISLESAALTSDGAALLVCFGERTVEALEPRTGNVIWSVSTGSDTVQVPLSIVAARHSGETFFGAGNSVLAVDATSTTLKTDEMAPPSKVRPSGPPPGGRVLPELPPVVPKGALQPKLVLDGGSVVAELSDGWLDEPSPPIRDLNGTYHLFATRRHAAAVNKGAVIVHFESSDGAEWTGGEVVLSPSVSGWDSGGVFSPGAAINAINATWSLYYSGIAAGSSDAWLGLATSASPSAAFVRAGNGSAVVQGFGGTTNGSGSYVYAHGAIPAGGDLGSRNTTVAAAELHCSADPMCKGFTFRGTDPNPPEAEMLFKRMDT